MIPMDSPYWVADFFVDPYRNQITRSEKTVLLQPKVVAVLNVLAKHAGKVVSHDELMSEVWPDTYVSPNTLQRCIAELRKTLGDNSKTQGIIKTHSKQGYSLEVPVSQDTGDQPIQPVGTYVAIGCMLVLVLIGYVWFAPSAITSPPILAFNSIQPLTATDEKEYYPDYSPNGQYMVFHRYLGQCDNHIWAKDLTTQQEFRLTRESAIYGQHSWSSDGSQLAFTRQQNCAQSTTENKQCWQLHTLDFAAALREPQLSVKRLDCDSRRISKPKWLSDGSLLMLEDGKPQKLIRYHPNSDNIEDFFTPEQGDLLHFDIAEGPEFIAVFQQQQDASKSWLKMDIQGEVVSAIDITMPDTLSVFGRFEPDFVANNRGFLVNTIQGLYRLSLEGEMTSIPHLGSQRLQSPVMHASGNKLLATQGTADADIAVLNLADTKQTLTTLARSTGYDVDGKYQPNGSLIAFHSQRTGTSQIWLAEDEKVWQLSQFANKAQMNGLVWSPDGNMLATVVNDRVTLLTMDGQQNQLNLSIRLNKVLQWIDEKRLLVEGNGTRFKEVFILNIDSATLSSTGISDTDFAHVTPAGQLFFVDQQRTGWLMEEGKPNPLPSLNNKLGSKRFMAQNHQIYGMNWRHQFWRYDIADNTYTVLSTLPMDVWWVNDKRDNDLSVTRLVSSQHEIIELKRSVPP